ncbi:TetR/AcrR family transcriptional regulator [Nonomuraea ceibae]|uniref:TetR/AcrR family transcriptional regulator n=1 Tax=Nonomuraea ceibae TaxID=1935170 RepID=UPI001C5DC7A7|nr:TetR/AcrR family transcriptional regulator [Nonomuraea ceibae]
MVGVPSARKREAILTAAREVFLRDGYGGAAMDDIAGRAAVSKVTVYNHFADKERLFVEVITQAIREAESQTQAIIEKLATSDDLERDLRRFARQHLTVVLQPHLVQMRRVIIGEADRFPELARAWHQAGPQRGATTLARVLQELTRRGLLRVPDPPLAAEYLNWLILSVPLNRAMFHVTEAPHSPRQLRCYADEAARIFLAAYGTAQLR